MALAARAIAWPIPVTDVRRSKPQHALLIGLTACFASNLALPPRAGSESFGRWEHQVNSCKLLHQSADQRGVQPSKECLMLRLEQNIEGLLTARFLAAGEVVVFAGALAKGQQPMRCNQEGVCKPQWPTQLEVSTVASGKLEPSGLPAGLPQARLARGNCVIEHNKIECQALASDGEQWRAQSQL
jgi:hypothetical protein